MFHVKHYKIMKGGEIMELADLVQALVETESQEERMKMVEDNVDLLTASETIDVEAITQELEQTKQALEAMTASHGEVSEKYKNAFWTKIKGGPIEEVETDTKKPSSIDELNLD